MPTDEFVHACTVPADAGRVYALAEPENFIGLSPLIVAVRVTFPALLRALVVGQARQVQAYRAAELLRRMSVTPAR